MEEYLGFAAGNVVYYEGGIYKEVADKIAYANGINYNISKRLLFVASPRTFKINVYEVLDDNELNFISKIPCGSGIDNLEFDTEGGIWTGAHPNLLKFKSYSKNKSEISPSEILKINYNSPDDYQVEPIFTDKGEIFSASSAAAPFGPYVLVGTVKDNELTILKRTTYSTEK